MIREGAYACWIIIGLMLASGCTRADRGTTAGPHRFEAALLTPGPVSDAGWNASAYDGLKLIQRRLGAETVPVQTRSPADFEDALPISDRAVSTWSSPMASSTPMRR